MTLSRTDIIQSFRLRFWRESHHGSAEDWRGDVWHEQQNPGEEKVVVANAEEAFEFVRRKLTYSETSFLEKSNSTGQIRLLCEERSPAGISIWRQIIEKIRKVLPRW